MDLGGASRCPACGTEHAREHRGGPRANSGGPRRNAGRPRLPRLTADEAKALLRELAPDARTPAEVARALGCRPERVREALRGGCTVATAERWRNTRGESYGASVEAFGVADALSTHPHLGLEEG